jgi:hypothetical protein
MTISNKKLDLILNAVITYLERCGHTLGTGQPLAFALSATATSDGQTPPLMLDWGEGLLMNHPVDKTKVTIL